MKLHLPKLLLVAVVAAACFAQAADYNVGNLSGQKDKLPSTSSNYHVLKNNVENGFELSGSDRLGYIVDNKLATSFGKEEWTKNTTKIPFMADRITWDSVLSGTVTPNVKVNGTLTVKGEAVVSLGGQYKQNNKVYGVDVSSSAEFTGIIADTLLVQEKASVTSYNALVDNLTVEGGTVNIHTSAGEGNLGMRLEGATDSKQVQIKKELNVSGGNVTIGHAGYINSTYDKKPETHNPQTEYHTVVSFGSFSYTGSPTIVDSYIIGVDSYNINSSKITQSDGNLKVAGKSLSIGGLNIEQTGGTMEISKNTYHFLSDYGDSEIKQSGGTMTLGCLKAYNSYYDSVVTSLKENGQTAEINPSVAITQDGAGVMNLNGVIFTNQKTDAVSGEHSTIAQSGGGVINLNGNYDGAIFDITQSGEGGTINLNGTMSADTVKQSGNSALNIGKDAGLAVENMTVGSGSTLTNDGFIVVSGGIVLKDGATLTNNGTITGSSTFALMTADEQAAVILSETEDLIILEAGAELINEGSIEKDILVKGGTLTLANSEGSTQNITMESGTIYVTGQGVQTGSLTLNGGTINFADGATVALDENQTYDLSGAEIIVMVDDVNNIEGSTVTLFSGNGAGTVTGLESATFKFQDANAPENVVTGTITDLGSGSIKVEATVAIPEPTTATLSLLALAGLCARRRRC